MICWYQHIELLISTNGCWYQQLTIDIKESIELLISTNHLSISTIQTDLLTWTNNLLIPTIHFLISTNRWNSWYQQIAKGEMGLNCGQLLSMIQFWMSLNHLLKFTEFFIHVLGYHLLISIIELLTSTDDFLTSTNHDQIPILFQLMQCDMSATNCSFGLENGLVLHPGPCIGKFWWPTMETLIWSPGRLHMPMSSQNIESCCQYNVNKSDTHHIQNYIMSGLVQSVWSCYTYTYIYIYIYIYIFDSKIACLCQSIEYIYLSHAPCWFSLLIG